MGKDNGMSLHFASISRKKVEADFDGGTLTSDGGVVDLRAVDTSIGLIERLCDCISDDRHQSYVDHSLCDLRRQRVYQIALGYEDANDCDSLRSDPAMKMACDRLPVSGDDLDSHFSTPEVHDYCEDHDLFYVFGQAGNARLNALGAPLLDQAKMLAQDKDGKVRRFSAKAPLSGTEWSL